MSKKYLYLFSEGNKDMREILGGKGANLAEMTNAGMPVPQGFTISTEACTQYYNDGRQINEEIMADIYEYIGKLEEIAGKKFGDVKNPLLVSVRSGARASMPGMMDTILNLGLNDVVVEDGDAKLASDGTRAGSTLTTGQALKNLVKFTGEGPEKVLPLLTENPADLLGLPRKGRIAPGCDADFVVLGGDLTVLRTIVGGRTVYTAE